MTTFVVRIEGCTVSEAEEVITERLAYDEDYGFPYGIVWHRHDDDDECSPVVNFAPTHDETVTLIRATVSGAELEG